MLVALLLIASASSSAAAQTELRYSDHEPLGNMRTSVINTFFQDVEKRSNGRLKIERHWGGDISSGYDALSKLSTGSQADLTVIVPEYSAKALPLHQVFKGFLTGPSGANQVNLLRQIYARIPEFDAELRKNDVVPVLISTGYPVGFFSSRQMEGLQALKGHRWRTASFWHRDFLTNYGAVPVTMPWGPEVATALGDGRLDGLMVNIDSAVDLDVPKTAPHSLVSKRLWLGHVYIVGMNRAAWDRLSEADRRAFKEAADIAYRTMGATMDRRFDEMVVDLRRQGKTSRLLTTAEVDSFADASDVIEVQDTWARAQEAQGVSGARSVLKRVRTFWRRAISRED